MPQQPQRQTQLTREVLDTIKKAMENVDWQAATKEQIRNAQPKMDRLAQARRRALERAPNRIIGASKCA